MVPPTGLPDHLPQNYWSVDDVFGGRSNRVRCFVHRDYEIGMHSHAFVEVNIVVSGAGRHHLSGGVFPTSAGDVFVVPPKRKHGYEGGAGHDVYHLIVHPQFLAEHRWRLRALPGYVSLFTLEPHFRKQLAFRNKLRLSDADLARCLQLLADLEGELQREDTGAGMIAESLTVQVIVLLCRWYSDLHAAEQETVAAPSQLQALRRVMAFVRENYAQKLTLADLAGEACLERSHFSRLFKRVMGIPPMELVREQRVQEACRLLCQPDMTVTDTAYAVGFYDAAHFSKNFSRLVGISPKRFQQRHRPANHAW